MIRILFVCTANICRSPTAEGVFRALVAEHELVHAIDVDSAGVWDGFAGEPPDAPARAAAKRRGIDLSGLRARQVRSDDFERFDLLVAMEHEHLAILRDRCPSALHDKLVPFMQFVEGHRDADVPDPYGGGAQGFELVLDLCEVGCAALLAEVRQRWVDGSSP